MKKIYVKNNRKKVTVFVTDEIESVLTDTRRAIWRNDANFKNNYYSLDERSEQGCDIEDNSQNPEILIDSRDDEKQKVLRLKILRQGLKTLSDKQASVIHKHFFLGMNFSEIAREESVDESTIRERIQSALKKLKKLF